MPTLEVVLGSITFLLNIYLGLFVFFRNRKSWTNRLFLALTLFIDGYVVINYLSLHPPQGTPENQLFWIRAVMSEASFIGPTLLLLIHTFPRDKITLKPYWLAPLIGLCVASAILSLSPYVFTGIEYPGGQPMPTPGPAMPVFFLDFGGLFLLSILLLAYKYRKAKGIEKVQHWYFLVGVIATFSLMALLTNLAVVLFKFSGLVFLGPNMALILVACIAYAIVRHRFLDIRLVVARTVNYTLLLAILGVFYAGGIFLFANLLLEQTFERSYLFFSTGLALFVAFTFQPLQRLLEKVTDSIFYKDRYDSQALLGKLSHTMASVIILDKLVKSVLKELLSQMKISNASLVLIHNSSITWAKNAGSKESPEINKKEILYLAQSALKRTTEKLLVFEELSNSKPKGIMRKNNLFVVLPLAVGKRIIGAILLGQKSAGDIYTIGDINVLKILAPEMAVAVRNAQSYEEIKRFTITLKEEVKKATADLQEANQQLKELDKRKDEFVSVVSHELRAPMTAIKGYISMVLEGDAGKIPSKATDFLQEATEGNERLIRLVNNMLNVSRIEEGRLTYRMGVVKLRQVAKDIFDDFKLEAEDKGLKISLDIPSGLNDQIYVDQDRIHEVVANLVSNAVKYTDKGSVTITLSQPRKNIVRLAVADTGAGIPTKDQEKLFQKFTRLDSATGKKLGTGLGLYISKLLIKEFGGEIGVQSKEGKGSLFWFELPTKSRKPS